MVALRLSVRVCFAVSIFDKPRRLIRPRSVSWNSANPICLLFYAHLYTGLRSEPVEGYASTLNAGRSICIEPRALVIAIDRALILYTGSA